MRSLVLAAATALALAIPLQAFANTTHYYYDPLGRMMGSFQVVGANHANQFDAADNPIYQHVFPTHGSDGGVQLSNNEILIADQTITSTDGHYSLNMQEDGNLVLYQINSGSANTVLWQTGTPQRQPGYLILQNCNLFLTQADNGIIWSSQHSGGSCTLNVTTSGHLVINQNGSAIWSAP